MPPESLIVRIVSHCSLTLVSSSFERTGQQTIDQLKQSVNYTLDHPVEVVSSLGGLHVHVVRLLHEKVPFGGHGRPREYGRDERHSDLLQQTILFKAYW